MWRNGRREDSFMEEMDGFWFLNDVMGFLFHEDDHQYFASFSFVSFRSHEITNNNILLNMRKYKS